MKKKEDEALRNELANNFKNALLEKQISNAEIIERTGIPKYTVSRMFSNDPIISMENAVKIAKAFDLSLNYLFGLPLADESTESISKRTGLTFNSIENLFSINETGKFSFISSLNKILEYNELPLLLLDLERYFEFTDLKKYNVIIPLSDFTNESEEAYKKIIDRIEDKKYRFLFDRDIENANLQSINDHLRKIRSGVRVK